MGGGDIVVRLVNRHVYGLGVERLYGNLFLPADSFIIIIMQYKTPTHKINYLRWLKNKVLFCAARQ